jgi:integrase
MSVSKCRDVWRARVSIDGKVIASRSGFARKADAKAWHDAEKAKYLAEGSGESDLRTFDDLLERFRRVHLADVRPATRRCYENEIKQRIEPKFKYLALDRISTRLCEEFRLEVKAAVKSPKTANVCLGVLQTILRRGVYWGALRKLPGGLEPLAIPKRTYKWWDDKHHIEAFLEAAKGRRYYPVYLTALSTGMRYGEIIGLGTRQIDFEAGRIYVHRQWIDADQDYGPPKYDVERWIDFDPEGELARMLREAAERTPNPDILFPSELGRHPLRGNVASRDFQKAVKAAKVPRITFHDMRHTFASWFMREHDDIWALSALLGHADVKTTMRYAHHSPRQRRQVLDLARLGHKSDTKRHLEVAN